MGDDNNDEKACEAFAFKVFVVTAAVWLTLIFTKGCILDK